MTWMVVIAVGLVMGALGLAVADVFWPFTVALVIGSALLWWIEQLRPFWLAPAWTYAKPMYAALYVVIGFAWVFFKWTRFVERAWRDRNHSSYPSSPPKWGPNSYEFSAYFFYWPLDMVAYALSDLLRDCWRFISRMVAQSFDRYAEWRFR